MRSSKLGYGVHRPVKKDSSSQFVLVLEDCLHTAPFLPVKPQPPKGALPLPKMAYGQQLLFRYLGTFQSILSTLSCYRYNASSPGQCSVPQV